MSKLTLLIGIKVGKESGEQQTVNQGRDQVDGLLHRDEFTLQETHILVPLHNAHTWSHSPQKTWYQYLKRNFLRLMFQVSTGSALSKGGLTAVGSRPIILFSAVHLFAKLALNVSYLSPTSSLRIS